MILTTFTSLPPTEREYTPASVPVKTDRVSGHTMVDPFGSYDRSMEWVQNRPFRATLQFVKVVVCGRGPHDYYALLRDVLSGTEYPMWGSDFEALVHGYWEWDQHLFVEGCWVVRKRGEHYGLTMGAPSETYNTQAKESQ